MGFNPEGEPLEGIGRGVVAPIEKWANVLDMLAIAAQEAANHFHAAGAPKDITLTEENVQIQEYHLLARVVFIFRLEIGGEEHFYPYTFRLGERIFREIAVTGRWPAGLAMPDENATRH